MASIDKETILILMQEVGVIPLFYHADAGLVKNVLKACYDGGARVFEFTNRGENAYDTFVELQEFTQTRLPGMALGIGTIFDADTARKFIEVGADFIVAPVMNPEVGKVCAEAGISWIPGIATLTEIYQALQAGAEVVKVFPGDVVGPGFVKAARGPMPHLRMMVTGGVQPTHDNLQEWFEAGAYCVGLGSNLFPREVLATGNFGWISDKVEECIELVKEIRG
jgi:2-dehydro-3-deoxyphosphogluconate aldolase / (4S)-4-hydroxy-2-oxoglutarate aldolase